MNKTCANCIHEKVCKKRHFPSMFGLTGDGCDDFKDKSRYIELPCAVGDTVYCIQPYFNHDTKKYKEIIKPKVVDFVFTMPFLAESKGEILREKDFGKTVFLTKEDAEKVLKGGAE